MTGAGDLQHTALDKTTVKSFNKHNHRHHTENKSDLFFFK